MKIIFITGAPGAGKTFASDFASELIRDKEKVIQIGADIIRDILRANIDKESHPALHASSLHSASHEHYIAQAELVIKKGILPAVLRGIEESKSIVIEGVNCVPSILNQELSSINTGSYEIINIVICVKNKETHLKQLKRQNDTDVSAKMGKIDKIRHMQDFLVADGRNSGAHFIESKDMLEQLRRIV